MIVHRRYQRQNVAVLIVERPSQPDGPAFERVFGVAILRRETGDRWTLAEHITCHWGTPVPGQLRRAVRRGLRTAREWGRV